MQTLKVLLKAANFCVSLVVILTMCAAGAFSVYALWDNSQVYRAAGDVQASIVVSASDDLIYQPLQWQADNVPAMLDRLQADALCVDQAAMDDLRTAQNPKVLCMSTCSSDYTDARTVVLAAMQLE